MEGIVQYRTNHNTAFNKIGKQTKQPLTPNNYSQKESMSRQFQVVFNLFYCCGTDSPSGFCHYTEFSISTLSVFILEV